MRILCIKIVNVLVLHNKESKQDTILHTEGQIGQDPNSSMEPVNTSIFS
jgi:hypothetical protein